MTSMFANAERVLASVGALALFALNDVRMFQSLPRTADPGNGQTHALWLQLMGASEQIYVSTFDLVVRWGLVGLTVAACIWALAETLKPQPPQQAAD
jgi:hypothetical protein